jgi:hypothetical protein
MSVKAPHYIISKNLSSGSHIEPYGLTDRHEKANTFYNFANVPRTVENGLLSRKS